MHPKTVWHLKDRSKEDGLPMYFTYIKALESRLKPNFCSPQTSPGPTMPRLEELRRGKQEAEARVAELQEPQGVLVWVKKGKKGVYIPRTRTCLTSLFGFKPPKIRSFTIKTRVKQVLG